MNLGFFVQKWPFCDAHLLSKRKGLNPPIFIVFLGERFWGQGVKKRKIWKATQKRKIWLITEKLFFGIFAVFLGGPLFSSLFLFPLFFVGGFRAWPKPSLLFFLFFLLVFFLGGLKGQVRWPEGPPHLALNPPYLFLLFLLFCFLFFFNTKKTLFSPRKGHFLFIFSVSLSFSLSLFWPPSFSVSLSLSLSFLLFFLSSFLSFLFAFFWFLVFVSFFLFLSSLLCFHERNNIKILNCKFCLHQYFLFFWFPVFFCFKFLFLIFAISWF